MLPPIQQTVLFQNLVLAQTETQGVLPGPTNTPFGKRVPVGFRENIDSQ